MQHRAKKNLGQNFLVDQDIIERIIDSIHPEPEDLIIEIGPGLGALTIPLLEYLECLHVIEFDRDIIPILEKKSDGRNLIIHESDVLKFDFKAFRKSQNRDIRIIGNLPYNISTPILFRLLSDRDLFIDMFFMLQKEVVERIYAEPGNKAYGRLSVMLQSYFQTTPLFDVPADSFSPRPKVESAIIKLTPLKSNVNQIDFKLLEHIVRTAFSQRRKTLKNTLGKEYPTELLESAGIGSSERAESIPVGNYVMLQELIKTNEDDL